MARTRVGRDDPGGGLLAVKLAAARCPYGLSVLSALARIHFGGRCVGANAHGQLCLEAFSQAVRAALFSFGTGLVAI